MIATAPTATLQEPITRSFVLAGNATFTVEIPEAYQTKLAVKPHYTVRVTKRDHNGFSFWFVNLLAGPDNTSDYVYLGSLCSRTGGVRITSASKLTRESIVFQIISKVLARVWENDVKAITDAGWGLHHEGVCCRCGRALTTPESIRYGIGPECRKHVF